MRLDITKRGLGVNSLNSITDVTVWAPKVSKVMLEKDEIKIPLTKTDLGYWHTSTDLIRKGDKYKFLLDGNKSLPDPVSLYQPDGITGSSEVLDVSFKWGDDLWRNPPLEEYIIYEVHTGTFSETGDFTGIIERLPYLKELGITAIEIMPVAQFSGSRNWGYDGVFPFAVHNTYGGAAGLQKLVNACHEIDIAVILDVVYNHIGPEGSVLNEYGYYFTDKYKTPWGDAMNYDDAWCDGVRRYFIENVLMWFRDFHIDALRLDAVHAIKDFSAKHILKEMKEYVDELMKLTGRQYYMIVECDLNDTRFIDKDKYAYDMDAQWVDEFHHALRVSAGQKREGYYEDFKGIRHLAKAYEDAYVYDGIYSEYRSKTFGTSAKGFAGKHFIVFSQNHDQIGNRMMGERISNLVSFEMQKLMAGAVMIAPFIPLLFMGEEWAAPNPFLYFVSHSSQDLCEAVRKGRAQEFEAFHSEGIPPDPTAEDTFRQSQLQWHLPEVDHHSVMFRYYKALIALRKQNEILKYPDRTSVTTNANEVEETLIVFRHNEAEQLACIMNFSKQQRTILLPARHWNKLWDSAQPAWQGPGVATSVIKPGNPVVIQPESILIYTASYV